MSKIKSTVAALLLATGAASAVAANGPLDGLYQCTAAGTAVFATVVGQLQGPSIWTIAAVGPTNALYGYGIGTAGATSFTGMTSFNLPFQFAVGPGGSFSGTIGIILPSGPVQAPVSCTKLL